MAITINGTTGLAGVDGSASTPAVQGGDTNTGVFFPAADTVAVATGGSERVRVDSSGNVGIGTGSPATKLDVSGPASVTSFTGTTKLGVTVSGSTAATDYSGIDLIGNSQTNPVARIAVLTTGSGSSLSFGTSNSYGSGITNTAATIDPSGNLLVGGTGVIVYSKVLSQFDGANKYGFVANDTSNAASVGFAAFAVNGTSTSGAIGSITRNGSASSVLYNTTSDERLKENIADADAALDTVASIKVRKYDWKEGGQHEDYGFIAQELAEVVNNVVSKGRTEDDMWAVDYGKLTPLLCKAIQEQQALIESLTARIAALEAA